MDISRKRFVEAALGGAALLLFSGCGGGYDGDGNPAPTSSCGASIANNHGHALAIAVADLDSPTAKTYDITGTGDHAHTVTFSPMQLQQLKAGTSVATTSSAATTDGHTHVVSVTCVIY